MLPKGSDIATKSLWRRLEAKVLVLNFADGDKQVIDLEKETKELMEAKKKEKEKQLQHLLKL